MYACAGVDTVGIITNDVTSGIRCRYANSKESVTLGPSKLLGMYMIYIGV